MMTYKTAPVNFLLVDDLEENLLALEALLRRDGLVLLKARSGNEALELLLKHDIALALMDVQMPGMDGFELAELMRGTERTRAVPIIFLTAANDDRQRRFRGYEAGAVDFLCKPIDPDILRSKAQVFFDLYRQKQQLAAQRDDLKTSAEENARLLKESRQYADALKEADRRKDEFIATLAHELRNPLAPIRNGLEILRMTHDENMAVTVRDMMGRQMSHLVRLIDDLLDISRVSQGKIDLIREPIIVQDALRSAVEAAMPVIDQGNHVLTLDIPDAPLWINADLTRISQIATNLLNNASKYTPNGGKIKISLRKHNQEAVIAVSDNGLGIPPDMMPRIFDLFTQVNRNLDRAQGGLGIGLALVKRLIDMHEGSIRVESGGLNQGSVFTLHFPLTSAKSEELPAEPKTKTNTAPLKILIVDDNVPSAQTIGWMLELIGHQTVLAHSGTEAVETAKKENPDVIMLDIGLPGMNGYEVCRLLRQDPIFKNTVFIAQTGWGQERDRQEAQSAGFDQHLVKPVSLQDLSAVLANVEPKTAKAA